MCRAKYPSVLVLYGSLAVFIAGEFMERHSCSQIDMVCTVGISLFSQL